MRVVKQRARVSRGRGVLNFFIILSVQRGPPSPYVQRVHKKQGTQLKINAMPQRKKTIEEHKQNGTFSPGLHSPRLPGKTLSTLPPPPFKLPDGALKYYKEEGEKLIAQGLLNDSDLLTLAQYSSEMLVYVTANSQAISGGLVIELSNGMPAQNTARKIAADALKNCMALADRLGLSPRGRHGIKGPAAFDPPEPDKPDPFEEVMRLMEQSNAANSSRR